MSAIELVRAGVGDIPFVMATERQPGFEMLVGRSNETVHEHNLADPSFAYFLARLDGAPFGFAILTGLQEPFGNVYLKRIAVESPDLGLGQRFFARLMDWVFEETKAHRFWLDLLADNARARHVYGKAGLSEDGVLREAYLMPDGRRVSQILMAILRPEWASRRAGPAEAPRGR